VGWLRPRRAAVGPVRSPGGPSRLREVSPARQRRSRRDRRGRSVAGAPPAPVAFDRWLALAVVAATVGLPPPIALRRLGPVERGVLGGHLAALLGRWGTSITVDLGEPGSTGATESLIGVRLRADVGGVAGTVRLYAPAEWLSLGRAAARPGWHESPSAAVLLY